MLSKVCEVFTKEYRKETAYQEFTAKIIRYFKLNNNSESVEDKVERLKGKKYMLLQLDFLRFLMFVAMSNYAVAFLASNYYCICFYCPI